MPPDSMTTTSASSMSNASAVEEDRPAQIERLAVPVDVEASIEGGDIERQPGDRQAPAY